MSAQDVLTVSIAVSILVQFSKWQGVPDGKGPIVVLVLSAIGVAFWAYSAGNFTRATAFLYFSGWLSVALNSAGIFGFTRASAKAITATKDPPPGAGASPTE